VRDPTPDAAWYPVHEQDIADVAALALLEDGHRGRAYTLNGPEMLSHRRQAELIAEAIGRPVRFEVVSRDEAREIYRKPGGFAATNPDFLLGFEDYSGGETDLQALKDSIRRRPARSPQPRRPPGPRPAPSPSGHTTMPGSFSTIDGYMERTGAFEGEQCCMPGPTTRHSDRVPRRDVKHEQLAGQQQLQIHVPSAAHIATARKSASPAATSPVVAGCGVKCSLTLSSWTSSRNGTETTAARPSTAGSLREHGRGGVWCLREAGSPAWTGTEQRPSQRLRTGSQADRPWQRAPGRP
jgi:hypothetical protein